MDKERIRRAALGKRGSDIDARHQRRLRTYVIMIIALVLWMVLSDRDAEPPVERARRSLDPVDVPSASPDQPLAHIDPERLASVRDGSTAERSMLEREALDHLRKQAGRLVYGDLEKLGLVEGDWDALVEHGAEHRGQPVWTLGTLQWIEREMVDGYLEVRGEVRDREGRPWAFIVLTEPGDLIQGDVVKLAGFSFKAYELRRPDGEPVTAPLIVGDEILESAWPMAAVTELAPDALDNVFDTSLAQASAPLDSPEFYTLLSYVQHASRQQLLAGHDDFDELLPSELLARPFAHRGRPVKLTGVAYYLTEAPLGPRGENPLGIPFGWNLWFSDNRAGPAGMVLAVGLERPVGVEEGQIVEVEGLFFRRYGFENKNNQPRMASVVIMRDAHTFVPLEDTLTPTLVKIVTGLVAALVLLIVIGQWRERSATSSARSRRMRRHHDNVARPGLLNPPDAPSATDAPDAPDPGDPGDPGDPADAPDAVDAPGPPEQPRAPGPVGPDRDGASP